MRILAIALSAALGLSGCTVFQDPKLNQGTTTAPTNSVRPGSNDGPGEEGKPDGPATSTPSPITNLLQKHLKAGNCNIVLLIGTSKARDDAEGYKKANGAPTDLCPQPRIEIVVSAGEASSAGQSDPKSPYYKWVFIPYGTS